MLTLPVSCPVLMRRPRLRTLQRIWTFRQPICCLRTNCPLHIQNVWRVVRGIIPGRRLPMFWCTPNNTSAYRTSGEEKISIAMAASTALVFVNWVYNNVCGTNINSDWTNAQSLYDGYCTPVSEAEARPGDIIFWKGTYQSLGYISHVGIYCGNGICIDAGDPIGYDHVTDIRNMNGVPAERVYGRLVSLSSTSVDLNAAITKVRVADQAYMGGACTPSPTVVSAGSVLNEGTDYWVSYENNVNVGTATIVIHGAGRFGGQEMRKNFQIYEDSFEGGACVVSSALNPSQVLDVPSGSSDSGVAMQLYSRNDTDAQTFEFEKRRAMDTMPSAI